VDGDSVIDGTVISKGNLVVGQQILVVQVTRRQVENIVAGKNAGTTEFNIVKNRLIK